MIEFFQENTFLFVASALVATNCMLIRYSSTADLNEPSRGDKIQKSLSKGKFKTALKLL